MDKVDYEFSRGAPLSAGGHLVRNVDLKAVMAQNRMGTRSKSPKKKTPKGVWGKKPTGKYCNYSPMNY